MIFGIRKLESWGYRAALFADPTFSRFDAIPECDRHTTTAYTALSIASRGKNEEITEGKIYSPVGKFAERAKLAVWFSERPVNCYSAAPHFR